MAIAGLSDRYLTLAEKLERITADMKLVERNLSRYGRHDG